MSKSSKRYLRLLNTLQIAVGRSPWMMYLSAALQFNSVVTVIIRSLCTKMVDAGEKGRVFAVVALGQALVPMVVGPALGALYQVEVLRFHFVLDLKSHSESLRIRIQGGNHNTSTTRPPSAPSPGRTCSSSRGSSSPPF